MNVEMIAVPGTAGEHRAVIFDPAVVEPLGCNSSNEVMERCSVNSNNLIAIKTHTNILKMRLFLQESPPDDLIAGAQTIIKNQPLIVPSGVLCSGWTSFYTPNEFYLSKTPHEKRGNFLGQFVEVPPGSYRVDIYSFMDEEPQKEVSSLFAIAWLSYIAAMTFAPYVIVVSLTAAYFLNWQFGIISIPFALCWLSWFAFANYAIKFNERALKNLHPDVILTLYRSESSAAGFLNSSQSNE